MRTRATANPCPLCQYRFSNHPFPSSHHLLILSLALSYNLSKTFYDTLVNTPSWRYQVIICTCGTAGAIGSLYDQQKDYPPLPGRQGMILVHVCVTYTYIHMRVHKCIRMCLLMYNAFICLSKCTEHMQLYNLMKRQDSGEFYCTFWRRFSIHNALY